MRSRGIARARAAIEAVTGGREPLVQERKLGHGACALGSTLLAIGKPDGFTTSISVDLPTFAAGRSR